MLLEKVGCAFFFPPRIVWGSTPPNGDADSRHVEAQGERSPADRRSLQTLEDDRQALPGAQPGESAQPSEAAEGTSLSGAELFSDLCLALTPSEWKEGEEGYEHIEDALCDLERAFEDTVRALVEDP